MIKKHNLIFLATLLSVLLVILSGCGTSHTATDSSKDNTQKEPIKIGVIFPLTGGASGFGKKGLDGAQIAADLINNEGGILGGRKIQLLIEDDQNNPEMSVSALKKLMQQGVSGIAGTLGSTPALATAPLTNAAKMPQSFAYPSVVKLRQQGYQYSIFNTNTVDMEGEFYVNEFVAKTLKPKTIVYLAENIDFSRGYIDLVQKLYFEPDSPKILGIEWFNSNDTDFTVAATKIKGLNPEAVQITANSSSALAAIVIQLRQAGYKGSILGSGGNPFIDDVLKVAGNAAEGAYSQTVYTHAIDNSINKEFVEAFQTKYPGQFPELEESGFESLYILAKAMDKAGTATDSGKIMEAVKANKWETPRGEVTVDSVGQVQPKSVYILQVKNGKNVVVKTVTK